MIDAVVGEICKQIVRWALLILLIGVGIGFLIGCVGPAPTISRPDNLVIECETKCKFSVPMNNQIVTAKATNFYDALGQGFRQLPILGSLLLSWKSMDVAETIADQAIASFNKGVSNVTTTTNTTNTSTVGDTTTTTSGDQITGDTGSGNTTSGDVANTSGDTVTGDKAGGDIDKGVVTTTTTTTNSNAFNNNSNQGNPNNSNQGNNPVPTP